MVMSREAIAVTTPVGPTPQSGLAGYHPAQARTGGHSEESRASEVCSSCGETYNKPDAKFCSECGEKRDSGPRSSAEEMVLNILRKEQERKGEARQEDLAYRAAMLREEKMRLKKEPQQAQVDQQPRRKAR